MPAALRRRSTIAGAAGALAAQGTAAAGNLVIQVAAARSLDAAGYGRFSILFAALLLAAGLHGGFVGDARTVLDRHDPAIRDALAAVQVGSVAGGAALAALACRLSGLTDGWSALVFGLVTAVWLLEDAGRRLFMTRFQFARVALNDLVYLGAALAALAGWRTWVGSLDLRALLVAMAVGAAAAVVDAVVALPSHELAAGRTTRHDLGVVARFGAWRSAHAGIRPLATLVLRALVPVLASAAALGRLEAARLVIAPVLLVANGAGSFLLPLFSRRRDEGVDGPGPIGPTAAAMVGVTLAYGAAVTLAADRVMPLITGTEGSADRWAIAGWCLFAAAFAAGIPAGTSLVARQRSRLVFRLRVVDSLVGVAVALVLVAVFEVSAAPYGLALGATVGAWLAWSEAMRASRSDQPRGATP